MNKRIHKLFHIYRDVSFRQMPKKKISETKCNALVILLGIAQFPSTGVVTFYILYESTWFSTASPSAGENSIFANLIGQNQYFDVIFICISLVVGGANHLSYMTLCLFFN